MNYWLFGDYLGLGAGAHGKLSLALPQRILRTTKPKQPREYQEQMRAHQERMPAPGAAGAEPGPIGESAFIATADLPFEFMLNALRLNEGFTVRDYHRRTGLEIGSLEARLADARTRGLLESREGGWRPTTLGRRFLNDLQASFLA
jgi:oxygen-independent coproporphyrinogen-3 oxidase